MAAASRQLPSTANKPTTPVLVHDVPAPVDVNRSPRLVPTAQMRPLGPTDGLRNPFAPVLVHEVGLPGVERLIRPPLVVQAKTYVSLASMV